MRFLPNGKVMYDSLPDLYYNLFMEIGLNVNQYGRLYDQDTQKELFFKERYIKASVTQNEVYAGKTDILFDPMNNYQLMVMLLGYYIDKEASMGNDIKYIAQYTEDNVERDKQRVSIKTAEREYVSQFYYNIYLAYFECIFMLAGINVELSNFDIPREQ